MFLQLAGKFIRGEKFLQFVIPDQVTPSTPYNVELVSITFCDDANHANLHFPEPDMADYPAQQAYAENIQVPVPRPVVLQKRRSSIYVVPNLDLETPDNDFSTPAAPPLLRRRRSVDRDYSIPPVSETKRRRRAPPGDLELQVSAKFEKNASVTTLQDVGKLNVKNVVTKLNGYQMPRLNNAFQNLLLQPIAIEARQVKAEEYQMSVTLPAYTSFGTAVDKKFWRALGFYESTDNLQQLFVNPKNVNQAFFGFNNDLNPVARTFTASTTVPGNMNMDTLLMRYVKKKAQTPSYATKFVNVEFGVVLNKPQKVITLKVGESEACSLDARHALELYTTAVRQICSDMRLNVSRFKIQLDPATNKITLVKLMNLSTNEASDSFSLTFVAGEHIKTLLGLGESGTLTWFPGRVDATTEALKPAEACAEIPLPEDRLELEDTVSVTTSDKPYEQTTRPPLREDDGDEPTTTEPPAATESQAEPPAAIETPAEPQVEDVQEEEDPVDPIEAAPDAPPEEGPAVIEAPVVVDPPAVIVIPLEPEPEEPGEPELPVQEDIVPAEEVEEYEPGEPPEQDPVEEDLTEQVPNPIPKPASRFEIAKRGPKGRCPAPENFPDKCTVLLSEAVPADYCVERGFCAVLATILGKDKLKIVPNNCTVATAGTSTLTLEFVDEHLNSFTPTERDAYVKVDLKIFKSCKTLFFGNLFLFSRIFTDDRAKQFEQAVGARKTRLSCHARALEKCHPRKQQRERGGGRRRRKQQQRSSPVCPTGLACPSRSIASGRARQAIKTKQTAVLCRRRRRRAHLRRLHDQH
jgi:hypothetical protein